MQNDKAGKWAIWQTDGSYVGAYETPEDAARAAMDVPIKQADDSAIVCQWRRTGPVTIDIPEGAIYTTDGIMLDLNDAERLHLETKLSVSLNQWMRHEVMSRHHCVIDEATEQCITRRDLELATGEPVPGVCVEPFAKAVDDSPADLPMGVGRI